MDEKEDYKKPVQTESILDWEPDFKDVLNSLFPGWAFLND